MVGNNDRAANVNYMVSDVDDRVANVAFNRPHVADVYDIVNCNRRYRNLTGLLLLALS